MADGFVTIWNPVNGLPWECPDNDDSLAYYVGEKGFTKSANKKTPADVKAAVKEDNANG